MQLSSDVRPSRELDLGQSASPGNEPGVCFTLPTSKDAWNYLRKVWVTLNHGQFWAYVVVEGERCFGLCACITQLRRSGMISHKVAAEMNTVMDRNVRAGSYYWPRTMEGAVERVQFCKTQAIMTTNEAWEFLARAWATTKGRCAYIEGHDCWGICECIDHLFANGRITLETRREMLSVIPQRDGYIWPRTPEGAQMRAQFCKTQAEVINEIGS